MTRLAGLLSSVALAMALAGSTAIAAPLTGDGWVSLHSAGAGRLPQLAATGPLQHFSVTIQIPGLSTSKEEGYLAIRIPGQASIMEAGAPELPLVATTVALPDRGTPAVKLTVLEEETFDAASKILPSRGHFDRNTPPSSIPLKEGAAYTKNAFFPAASYTVTVDQPYIVRDFRGTAVRVAPVLYNPVTGKVRVLRKARLDITMASAVGGVNEKARHDFNISGDFAPIYKDLFVNYKAAMGILSSPVETAGRSLVICPDEWVDSLAPLQAWRKLKGQDSRVVKVSEISGGKGVTAEQVKTFVQAEYAKGGLTFVLLVGDAEQIPTLKGVNEHADADAMFTKLEGDDHVPDIFISRFSAKTAAEVDVQVARAVSYDKTPLTDDRATFYKKGTGIASNQGNPKDWVRANWLRDAQLAFRYTEIDQVYEPSATAAQLSEAINKGRSMINYIGHGSKYTWVTTGFKKSHIEALTINQGWWPMIWSVACVNGDFVSGQDCFAETWAKAGTAEKPSGSIGIVAASTNMSWVPPCDWQNAIVIQYMIGEKAWTGGSLHLLGLVKAMEKWGTDAKSEGVKMVEQCIYFGDASVQLRNDLPKQVAVTVEAATRHKLTLKVLSGGTPVNGARVSLTPAADQASVVGLTGTDGLTSVEVLNGPTPLAEVKVTVTGPNLLPVVDQTVAVPGNPPQPPPPQPPAPPQPEPPQPAAPHAH